jgi:hypothetical protein
VIHIDPSPAERRRGTLTATHRKRVLAAMQHDGVLVLDQIVDHAPLDETASPVAARLVPPAFVEVDQSGALGHQLLHDAGKYLGEGRGSGSEQRMGVASAETESSLAALRAATSPRIAVVGPGAHDDGWLIDPAGRCIGMVVAADAPGAPNAGTYALPIDEITAFLGAQQAMVDGSRPAWVPMPEDFGAWRAWDSAARIALQGSHVRPNTVLVDFEAGPAGLLNPGDADFALHLGQDRRVAWYARCPKTDPNCGFDLILIDENNDDYADVVFERNGQGAWSARRGAGAPWLSAQRLSEVPGSDRIAVATAAVRSLTR